MTIELGGRHVALQESVYKPIVDLLADNQPRSIGEIQERVAHLGVQPLQVLQAAVVLIAINVASPAQPEKAVTAAQARPPDDGFIQ